jgi:hypothetical protein
MKNWKIITTVLAILIVAASAGYAGRVKIKIASLELRKKILPQSVTYQEAQKKTFFVNGETQTIDIIPVEADLKVPAKAPAVEAPTSAPLPESYNLGIPFVSQAPFAVWDEIHKETCEEASVLMAARFILGKTPGTAAEIDKEFFAIIEWEKKNFGFFKDTDAAKTAEILRKYYGLKNTEVKYGITLDDIRREIAAGNPVIIPLAGRMLGNPYYTPPGPFYHMLVVRGYTKDKIITNDPGTKHGENFIYENGVFFNAMHDWNGGEVLNGRKAVVVVKR